MRCTVSVAAHAASAVAGLMLAVVLIPAGSAQANEPHRASRTHPSLQPDFRTSLNDDDEIATLDAIHVALSQVGDGGSYVWHRNHGRLSGIFQPTQSFKDPAGQVCRHLVVLLTSGAAVRKTEGIACRLPTGRWQLDG